MKKKTALVFFTESFPYYPQDYMAEQTFLEIEMHYLAKAFQPVIVVPSLIFENRSSLPAGVEVDASYSDMINKVGTKSGILHLFRTPLFFEEMLARPRFWLRLGVIRGMVVKALIALFTRDWTIELIHKHSLDPKNTILYTYWLNSITLGIGMAKQRLPAIRLVSRTHGGDLYAHRKPFNYFPYRPQTLCLLDRLFLVSEHGRAYLTSSYPWMSNLCEVSRLGIRDFNSLNLGSMDGVFRIVSCSSLIPIKRVQLLINGIARAALERPRNLFEWNHLGDGPMGAEIRLLASENLPSNVTWHIRGSLPNEAVIRFYGENPIDLFANVSSSEGISVSIMEATCFGIPIMATAVGGTPEIVSECNGKLLSSDPSPDEISRTIVDLLDHPQFRRQMGEASRQMWQENYDADRNYPEFVNRLITTCMANNH